LRGVETNAGDSRPVASVPPRATPERARSSTHVLQFCDDDQALTLAAADFLAEGIASGQAVVAFATPARREAMRDHLRTRGLDVEYLERESRFTIHDARATLATFMAGDMPDPRKFSHSVGAAVERLCEANHGADVRAFGEMVSLLWQDGNTRAAIRLEELWNELTETYPLALLCSYAGGGFLAATAAGDRAAVVRLHTHILDPGSADLLSEPNLPAYRSLAERTVALERELEERTALEARLREALVAQKVAEDKLRRASAEREDLLQREREARAEAEAANRAKVEFLSIMSHELRTPLNAIGGHVQLIDLELHGPVTPAQRAALARIAKSQQHLLTLVNDVLNLARIETGQIEYVAEEVPLPAIVQEIADGLQPLFDRVGLTCEVSLPPDGAPLIAAADGEKVRQILLNLFTNTVKFTRSGGRVTVGVSQSGADPDVLNVWVRDTGVGIAAVRLRHLFEPFGHEPQSTMHHLDGGGLSLSISRDLARGMGGDLSAESAPGEGSTFTLELPRAAAPARPRRSVRTADAAQPGANS